MFVFLSGKMCAISLHSQEALMGIC